MRMMRGLLLTIMITPPMARSNERKPSTTRRARSGGLHGTIPRRGTKIRSPACLAHIVANSSSLKLAESASRISCKIRDLGMQNPRTGVT